MEILKTGFLKPGQGWPQGHACTEYLSHISSSSWANFIRARRRLDMKRNQRRARGASPLLAAANSRQSPPQLGVVTITNPELGLLLAAMLTKAR